MIIPVNENNYFYDSVTGKRLPFDSDNSNINFRLEISDGYTLHVDHSKIKAGKVGIGFYYDNNIYMIEDSNYYHMIYAAYIIRDDIGYMFQNNISEGLISRNKISKILDESIRGEFSTLYISNIKKQMLNYSMDFANGKICFQTISNLVNNNKTRKKFGLPYLPYCKGIDKYNAYYMSIWSREEYIDKYSFNIFLAELIEKMNLRSSYSFVAESLEVGNHITQYDF